MATFFSLIVTLFVLAASLLIYFIPYMVARRKEHFNKTAIFVLNLFTGWTFIGWVLALVWAFTKSQKTSET